MSIVLLIVQRLRLIQDFHDKKDESALYKRKNNKHKTYKGRMRVIKVILWFLYLSVCFVVGTKTERLEEDSRKRIREGQR